MAYDTKRTKDVLAGKKPEEKPNKNPNRTLAKIDELLENLEAIRTEEKELFDSLPQTMKDLITGAEKVPTNSNKSWTFI